MIDLWRGDPLHRSMSDDGLPVSFEIEEDARRWCFGKGGGGSPPPAPDPAATAAAQGQANKEAVRETALVNQIGTIGPGGRTYYTGSIGDPDRTMVTELSPSGQQVYDSRQDIAARLGSYGQQLAGQVGNGPAAFSLDGLPAAPWERDYTRDVSSLERATYDRGANLLSPEFDRREESLRTQLANQGITIGSEAYDRELNRFGDERARAMNDLSLASVAAGRQEQSRLYGMDSASRGSATNEMLLKRTQPMNELAALLQGSPALAAPLGGSGSNLRVEPADYQGAANMAYQGALNNYQDQQQQSQAAISNLMGAAGLGLGAYMAFSDRRLKSDIREIGRLSNGIKLYSYKYLFGSVRHVGVMADEVRAVIPHAVRDIRGYAAVDYAIVMEAA